MNTTESLKGQRLYRCDRCGNRVPFLVSGPDRRNLCFDCMGPRDRAVFACPDCGGASCKCNADPPEHES